MKKKEEDNSTAMLLARFVILFMLFYIASQQYGLSLISKASPPIPDGWGKWILNQVLGILVSAMFSILWTAKTTADQINNAMIKKNKRSKPDILKEYGNN